MSETRAAKSGLARDVQMKISMKYDQDKAQQCMQWLKRATGEDIDTSGEAHSVHLALKDGVVLLKLLNVIQDGSVPQKMLSPSNLPFKAMEKISKFNDMIKLPPLEIASSSCFATADLFEEQNLVQVITCLESVARKSLSLGTRAGGFGPKEAEANKREFSEEQLAQGKTIIGLQMGSNKGATQAGQNFGKGRMIVD